MSYKRDRLVSGSDIERIAAQEAEADEAMQLVNPGITTTRQIRRPPPREVGNNGSCAPSDECHWVGLNLLKQLFNERGIRCRRCTAVKLVRVLRDYANVASNFACCTRAENMEDIVIEKHLLRYIREGVQPPPLEYSAPVRRMLTDLITWLQTTQALLRNKNNVYGASITLDWFVPELQQKLKELQ